MSAKSRSKHSMDLCKSYKANNTRDKNKMRKIRKHLKAHPNDVIATNSLKNGGAVSPKKPPNSKKWSAATKSFAHMLRKYTGTGRLIDTYARLERAVYG